MTRQNSDLTKLLKKYKQGWVALNQQQTKVLAHARTFTQVNEKIKDQDPEEVVLFPLGNTQSYFVGLLENA